MREAVIVDAIRTPIGRRRGILSEVHPVDLMADLLLELLRRNPIPPELVEDVILGCVDMVGEQAANVARNAWLTAGLPESVPAVTLDRQCGSSLQALQFAAQGVIAGGYDCVIAGGVESMSRVPMFSNLGQGVGTPLASRLAARYGMSDGWFSQAAGAERIAKEWGFTREQLDAFSLQSHGRAAKAQKQGYFQAEIVPVKVSDRQGPPVAHDEGIRFDTSMQKLAELKPAFPDLQLITAGNASQISDGASAVLVTSRETAKRLGLRIRARLVAFSVVGVNPVTMLTGPIPATEKVLQRAGLSLADIDLFEVNEAFASVVLAWQRETGVDWSRINVNGGAIALGHPLGATGTRIVATLLNELERRAGRYGLIAICEGGGMANAVIFERVND
ncbi:MAG: thiolase family protein [Alicyclobacillus herbarius]|uniref:thiolase family protein n=1 Tax=Alicyclobacillus herbarius TaxID=122960 RepID=UPI0023575ACC|nr:thiolase family protein [Alicyclobacillus herbarius]MCL6631525.1 thiolase family protein [Alicyclobacillus herbarius]